MSHPRNAAQRAAIVQELQRDYGNPYVQRLVDHIHQTRTQTAQGKLTVGPAGDKFEQEADEVAKQVVGRIYNPEQANSQGTEAVDDAYKEAVNRITRYISGEGVARRREEDEDSGPQVGLEGGTVGPDVEGDINNAKGGGQSLPDNVRGEMEGAFGADFSGVRVHTDSQADSLSKTMSARAFTIGRDVFFSKGNYNPGSKSGQEIIAHELTHVLQQGGASASAATVAERTLDQVIARFPTSVDEVTADEYEVNESDIKKADEILGNPMDYYETEEWDIAEAVKAAELLKGRVDKGIEKAVQIVSEADENSIKLAAEAFARMYAEYTKETEDSSTSGSMEASAQAKAYADFTKEGGENIYDGIKYLVDAGVVSKGSLEVKGEYTKQFGESVSTKLSGSLKAWAGADVNFKGSFQAGLAQGIRAQVDAKAEVGTGAKAETSFSIGYKDVASIDADLAAEVFAGAKAQIKKAQLIISKDSIVIGGTAVAFAGAEAKATGKAKLTIGGKDVIKVKAAIKGQAGIGGEIGGKFSVGGGKIMISADLAGALGLGFGGSADIMIDYAAIAEAIVAEIVRTWTSAGDDYEELDEGSGLAPEKIDLDNIRNTASKALTKRVAKLKDKDFLTGDKVQTELDKVIDKAIRQGSLKGFVGHPDTDKVLEDVVKTAINGSGKKFTVVGIEVKNGVLGYLRLGGTI